MKKIGYATLVVLTVTMLGACGNKNSKQEQATNEVKTETKDTKENKDGFYNDSDEWVTFKEVQAKYKDYQKAYKNEDYETAFELSDWLKAYNQINGLSEEQIMSIQDNHNPLINLDKVKNALDEAKEQRQLSYENTIFTYLDQFNQSNVSEEALLKIADSYQKEADELFDSIATEQKRERPSQMTQNSRVGSGNEDYDEDGNYIDGGQVLGSED
ncbi:hypothetical protein [uncultured Vagococcus sp.]|uniref:hypothetical protein n=1 Tax=uncultured Vagococcus sp. TaxID=189676 RepID=UPI0025830217|nr:hypothetical protein [uncultured Vagococcus sp.]